MPIKEKIANTYVSAILNSNGAQNGIRTHTVSLPVDFESTAATITPSGQYVVYYIKIIIFFQ